MTDKVQKIKDWISCQQDSLMDANGNFQHSEDEAVYDTLCNLDAYIDFLQEEPVSEGLGEYINEISKQFPEVSFAKLSRIAVRVAKWQKQQDQSTIELAEDHAMFAGMEKMKEQMMKDAVEGYIERDKGGQLILGRTNFGAGDEFMLLDASTFHDIKCGDRRKAKIMIIIKED